MSLRVDAVSVVIDGSSILHGIDLSVADREVVAVLGPSGSGKTTMLRVIAGLQTPTSGTVHLDDVDITRRAVHQRGIGLMFQDHALFPHRDVAANVAFGLRMSGTSRSDIQARVHEVLDLVGLAGFEQRSIDRLSGGERQRVALARALAPRPRLLLLDEPLGSLDRALREHLVDELSELLRVSGVSAIYVTHDQGEAFAIGDRLAVMKQGTVAQIDTPEQIWTAPADADVASIVGPVTLIPVDVGVDGAVTEPWNRAIDQATHPGETGSYLLVVRADTFSLVNSPVSSLVNDTQPPGSAPDSSRREIIPATVVDVTFRGDHHLVVVEVASGGSAEPAGPSHRLRVAHRGRSTPRPGDQVGLSVVHPPATVPASP